MFEKKFLAYILHISLLEIRDKAYNSGNRRMYWLSVLLNNIPFSLIDEYSAKEEYEMIIRKVEEMKINSWLEAREREFYSRYPGLSANDLSVFEKKFLAYILYTTILEIRSEANEQKDEQLFLFSRMLHGIPFILLDNTLIMEEYKVFFTRVDEIGLNDWLKEKKTGFYKRYPAYLSENYLDKIK